VWRLDEDGAELTFVVERRLGDPTPVAVLEPGRLGRCEERAVERVPAWVAGHEAELEYLRVAVPAFPRARA
jgi:hypothetical protein